VVGISVDPTPIGSGGGTGRGPPPPGWNGVPCTSGGKCEENLLIDLTITMDFVSMMETLDRCQRSRARDSASQEIEKLRNDDPEGIEPLSGLPLSEIDEPPEVLVEKHLKRISQKGYEHCAHDLVCPILRRAREHHENCKHKTIVIKVPSRLIQEIEDYNCWKEFEGFLERDGVDWTMLPA